MKTIILSVVAILFACATLFAIGPLTAKKVVKQTTCTKCSDPKCATSCTKTVCPDKAHCVCK